MYEEYLRHIPVVPDEKIEEFVNETALYEANYIFYKAKGKKQEAYCTKCKTYLETTGLRHNEKASCPICGGRFMAKSDGRGRKGLRDTALFTWYYKSAVDKDSIAAVGYIVERDWKGDYTRVENTYLPLAYYIFTKDESVMLKRSYWYSYDGMARCSQWEKTKSIYKFNINSLATMPCYSNLNNITETVKDTWFKYSCCENYYTKNSNMIKFFELYTKYPQIEQLTKVGLGNIVFAKLRNDYLGRIVNWRGKDVYKMLRLSKKDYRAMMKADISITPNYLSLYQINTKYKEKDRLTPSEVKDLEYIVQNGVYTDAYRKLLKHSTPKKIYKYINRQFENREKGKYSSAGIVLNDWRDYLEDCKKLEIDIKIENNIYPRDLFQAHENTTKQVKIKQDMVLDSKIEKRLEDLEKYSFIYNGLCIRPAHNSQEVIEEGKKQDICIGTYAKRYAEGGTDLFFIRKIGEENKPYYAVEIVKNKVVQVRGKRNRSADDDVINFMKAFEEAKLNKKAEKKIA